MDKKVVVHIHNGILLGYEKEHIWVSSNEVDESGACHSEWSKSERETPIQCISTYIWNLERVIMGRVMMTLYVRQQKRHRCKEQTFGLCGRRRGWDDMTE